MKSLKKIFKKIIYKVVNFLLSIHQTVKDEKLYETFEIHPTARFWKLSIEGKVFIGEQTYLNDYCRIDSGPNSRVVIGKHCAIGRRVHITSKTHDLLSPTTDMNTNQIMHQEKDTIVGNYVWIGDNVLINYGVIIGDYAVIGANSVVTQNVQSFEIVGGVPARHIRFNTEHKCYKPSKE